MNKILVVCGPTATGKTGLGVKLAQQNNGEIISADSRQIYKNMDISTGKDLPPKAVFRKKNAELGLRDYKYDVGYYLFKKIPVWLLDIATPDQFFTVADYYYLFWTVVKDIWRKNKLPIVVGGTGFYIKAATQGLDTLGIEPDWLLRKELQSFPVPRLQSLLKKADPNRIKRMNESDKKNPRRLIRALEVALSQGKKRRSKTVFEVPDFDGLFIGLKQDLAALYKKIDIRIEKQHQKEAKKEISCLVEKKYSWDLPSMTAMGYGEWKPYFEGKKSEKEVVERWKLDEHNYAKRQMVWFKKMPEIQWFDLGGKKWQVKVEKLVKDWYI